MLHKPTVVMKGFSGNSISCVGETTLSVTIGSKTENVLLQVVASNGPSLLGRELLNVFTLPWKQMFIAKVHQMNNAGQTIKEEFPKLFNDSTLGTLKGVEVTLHVDDKKPVFIKAHTVPFAIQDSYNATLDKLEAEGVIRKVTHSNWASPTVPVRNLDGSIRICADYSATTNKCCDLEHHSLPTLDDMLAKLSGGSKFTKLDLSQGTISLNCLATARCSPLSIRIVGYMNTCTLVSLLGSTQLFRYFNAQLKISWLISRLHRRHLDHWGN